MSLLRLLPNQVFIRQYAPARRPRVVRRCEASFGRCAVSSGARAVVVDLSTPIARMLPTAIAQRLTQFGSVGQSKLPVGVTRESSESSATSADSMMLRRLPDVEIDEMAVPARPAAVVRTCRFGGGKQTVKA